MKKNYSTFSFGKTLHMAMIVIMSMFAANSFAQLTCVGGSPTSPGANYSISCGAFQAISAASVSTDNGAGTVTIESLGGVTIANTLVGLSPYIGKVVKVTVTVGTNSCWGYVLIEDKQAPSIVCPVPVTLTCDQATLLATAGSTGQFTGATNQYPGSKLAAATNGTTDECSKYEQSYVDAGTIAPCVGGTITRTWRLKDVWGNTSVTCTQTITVLPAPAFTPPTFTDAILQCQNVSAAQKATLLAGGTITGVTLPSFAATACGLSLNFVSSREIAICPGSYKIIRRYEVMNMCGTPMINGPYEQIVQVLDQTSPVGASTYQNYGIFAASYCFFMQGMKMTNQYIQQVTAEVPVSRPMHTRRIANVVTSGVAATATTLASIPTITLTPRADANMCGAAQILLTATATDIDCSGGNVVWTSNDSRIRINGAASANVAGGATVTVTGFIMRSQGTTFTLYATDACGNVTSQDYNVNIVDNVSPQAVCVEEHRVSLNSNGTVRVYAQAFNNNRSSDNCGIERMHVRRADKRNAVTSTATPCDYTTANTNDDCASSDVRDYWNDYVDFDCGDAGRIDIMVQVRYVDAAGNLSDCMVNVTVDDKTRPICVSPTNISRDCTSDDLLDYGALFTVPAAYDNCGIASVVPSDNRVLAISCISSSVTRTWVFTDCAGNNTSCSQTLTVNPLSGFRITTQANQVYTCVAPTGVVVGSNAWLNQEVDRTLATVQLRNCGNVKTCAAPVVSVTVLDSFRSNQYCKIYHIRYVVLDQCQPLVYHHEIQRGYTMSGSTCTTTFAALNPNAAIVIQDELNGIVYDRYIYIDDRTAPKSADVNIGAICDGNTVATAGPLDADASTNCVFGVDVTLTGTDDCGTSGPSTPAQLYYMTKLQRFNTTTNAWVDVANTSGTSANVSLRGLAFGTYRIVYRITDLCGNMSNEYFVNFSGADCKAPEILVHNKVVALAGVTGNAGSGMARLDYADIFNRITDNCDGDLTFDGKLVMEIVLASDPTNPLAPRSATPTSSVMFNCSHVGTQRVRVWMRDLAGNWNYATSTITVQDNDGICGPRPPSVAGTIGTENNSLVKDVVVSVNANGSVAGSMTTPATGAFLVTNLTAGSNYQVRAAKTIDTDKKNGVTTLDIALISKHNLGIEALNSPYKIIAADVNKDGEVDATDMLHIRRFILNITPALPAGSAWRFIDKSYAFRNAANPLGEDFSEVVNLTNLSGQAAANFTAVKLGDVNNSFDASQVRGSRALVFNANDMTIVAGNEYTVAINAENFNAAAFQGTFAFEGASVKAVKAGSLNNTSDANFGMFNNAVTASWNGKSEASADVVNITFVATKSGKLSEMLTVNSSVTMAEGYDAAGNPMNVSLKFNTGKVAGGEFALYANTPNPFATSTTIGFNLPKDGQAKLTIYTAGGKVVSVINGTYKAGVNQVTVNKADLNASGLLYYRLDTQDNSSTRKMIIIE